MGFFQTFWSWLSSQLAGYIGNNTARVATALEPTLVTLGVLYVMAWGYLHLLGRIERRGEVARDQLEGLYVLAGQRPRIPVEAAP